MGVGWALIAFLAPGIPQLLHLDIFKALIIWFLPGLTVLTGGATLAIPIVGGLALGLLAFLYNLYTALQY